MTESQWLACMTPAEMLRRVSLNPGERKFRLFAVGCCRQAWDLYLARSAREAREAVEAAERFADGRITRAELAAAGRRVHEAVGRAETELREAYGRRHPGEMAVAHIARDAAWAAGAATASNCHAGVAGAVAQAVVAAVGGPVGRKSPEERQESMDALAERQAVLVRCIFGNRFRPVVHQQSWLAWNDGAIRKMARLTYAERAFDRLPLLGDALEDAGCDNADILAHCRGRGEHVRGCWVVDLLLGKR